MKPATALLRVALVVASALAPAIGCTTLGRGVHTSPAAPPSQRGIDPPPPLHTGGLSVLGTDRSGRGRSGSPAGHGDPVAEGIATAVGMAVFGATAARTTAACVRPDASPSCVRGPGPADTEGDAGR